jgi:integrase
VHLAHVAPELKHPEAHALYIEVLLRFFGARPADNPHPDEPYHDLRLADPIRDSEWLLRFEEWLHARGGGPQTRNHYRSALRRLYATALLPQFRRRTGIDRNPFEDLPRDRTVARTTTVSVEQLRAWIAHASYHVRLAVAIAALAPKLRLGSILALRWRDVSEDWAWLTVVDHKTAHHTGAPQVVPITAQLREILEDAKQRQPFSTHIVTYHRRPVHEIRGGVEGAAVAAGLTYGLKDGVTFHTIRHAMATHLATLDLPEKTRAEAMGHSTITTTQRYTHLRPTHQRPTLEQLSATVKIADLVTHPRTRAARVKGA